MKELKTRFKGVLRTLSDKERESLEQLILAEGIRDEIVVWGDTILDGNSRYEIAQKHGLSFRVKSVDFPDEHAAKAWMYKTQAGRRNAAPDYYEYCLGMEKKHTGLAHGGDRRSSGQSVQLKNTRANIAKEHGVNEKAVDRAEHFADGVNTVEEVVPGIKEKILSGNSPMTRTTLRNVGKLKGKDRDEYKERLADSIKSGDKPPKPKETPPKTMGDLFRKHGLKVKETPEPTCSTPLNVVRNAMDECMACPCSEFEKYLTEPSYHLGQKWVKEKLFSRYGKWFVNMAEKFESQTERKEI